MSSLSARRRGAGHEIPQLVNRRYVGGLSVADTAAMVGIGRSTAYEHWVYARAWLRRRLRGPAAETI
jgi:hypothetical protein